MKNFSIAKSRRLRSTPYTDRIEAHGVSSYTVYNHMLLPASFKSLESDYHHLKKYVQVWDVAAERQVEISGKDSSKLVQLSHNDENIKVLGPVEAPISLLRGQYRYRILLKGNNRKNLNKLTKKIVGKTKSPSSVKLIIDVDPYTFM